MSYSENEMAVLLLNSRLSMDNIDAKPFGIKQWAKFYNHVRDGLIEPKIVFENPNELKDLNYTVEEIENIKALVSRANRAVLDAENLEKKGIKILTRFHEDYPKLIKKYLIEKAPPVWFYAGNISNLTKQAVSFAGSRDVSREGIIFTEKITKKAVMERYIVISGGAKGVDSIAEKAAIASGGRVVSFISDSLESRIKKKDVIKEIINNQLLLITDFIPSAGFSVGRAMARNKYLYISSEASFVVQSSYNKGGTWNGAKECLNHKWGNVTFVWDRDYPGNKALIDMGAKSFGDREEESSIGSLIEKYKNNEQPKESAEVCEQLKLDI